MLLLFWPLLWAHLDRSGTEKARPFWLLQLWSRPREAYSQKDQLALCACLRARSVPFSELSRCIWDSTYVCALKGRRECGDEVLSQASSQLGGRPCETAFRGSVCMCGHACICCSLDPGCGAISLLAPLQCRGFWRIGPSRQRPALAVCGRPVCSFFLAE